MTRYEYAFTGKRPTETEAFPSASVEELKVLVALYELGGACSEEELFAASGVPKFRLASVLALWQAVGVITENADGKSAPPSENVTPYGNKITDEFEERVTADEIYEEPAKVVAENIRSRRLASLMEECAALMGKAGLSPAEVKKIAGLCVQYALSEEYVAVLASHLAENGILTVTRLVSRAIRLTEMNVNTAEELEAYIADSEREKAGFAELKRIFGIYDRRITPSEEKYFRKWLFEYSFDTEIIGEAYDITVLNTGKRALRYMDTILDDWHAAGCKTVDACRKRYDEAKSEKNAALEKQTAPKKKAETKKMRYGDFDPEEALRQAIERSYADDDE